MDPGIALALLASAFLGTAVVLANARSHARDVDAS
jgi:hypothetical protein